jgi:acetoin utilization deacetylase AcuC-like enzyme
VTDSTSTKGTGDAPTAFIYSPIFLDHDTGPGHPECSERLLSILQTLEREHLWTRLLRVDPDPASLDSIEANHTRGYIDLVRQECADGETQLSTGDTVICPETWEASLKAAGAACQAVDLVATGRVRNAFCAVRPPGHHSRPRGGMGFCVFNNLAIGVRHARARHGLERALVVDWDLHHGNGTQETFWEDAAVMQFHTHQGGIYPGTGWPDERGGGKAEGNVFNYPLRPGCGLEVFEHLYLDELVPAARRFEPDIVFVSAGYDSHRDDPLGMLRLDEAGFARLATIVSDLATELCGGRLVLCLEGGYHLEALGTSVAATIRVLTGG